MTALMGLDARLRLARVYLCTDAREKQGDLEEFLTAAFAGGVDLVQIRQKGMAPEAELEALEIARQAAAPYQGIVCVNDSAELAGRFHADMLHLGQTDGESAPARRHLHQWAILGRSTHAPAQIDAAIEDRDVDYFCAGPVYATSTKPDYEPVGLDLVRYAAKVAPVDRIDAKPWFAIGGISLDNLDEVIAAGARRVCVVRAITEASDPQAAADRLQTRLRAVWKADPAMERYVFQALSGAGPRAVSSRSKIIGGALATVLLVLLVLVVIPAGVIPSLTANPAGDRGRSAYAPEPSPSAPRSSAPGKRESSAPRSTAPSRRESSAPRSTAPSRRDPESGLRLVELAAIPLEARRTVLIIDRGGPFPYPRDGTTFFNRERLLPIKRSGFYREYTVPTPGENDRGARRIVTGDHNRQFLYTGDHYRTFVRIRR